jgi:hypothetical protein
MRVCSTCQHAFLAFYNLIHSKRVLRQLYQDNILPAIHKKYVGSDRLIVMKDIKHELRKTYDRSLANTVSTNIVQDILEKTPDCFFGVTITIDPGQVLASAANFFPIFEPNDPRWNPAHAGAELTIF